MIKSLWLLLLIHLRCSLIITGENRPVNKTFYVNYDELGKDFNGIKPVRYDGAQLWRLKINNIKEEQQISYLRNYLNLDIWRMDTHAADILIIRDSLHESEIFLKHNKISYNVLLNNTQELIDSENTNEIEGRDDIISWTRYHSLTTIYNFLKNLDADYPSLCELIKIGESTLSRPLYVLRITENPNSDRKVWVDGGMHAREWISPAAVTYVINEFLENWDGQSADVRQTTWYFLPMMNPDGYVYSRNYNRMWRKNMRQFGKCRGVDLNRNFGFKWGQSGSSSKTCSDVYRGPSPFSELESQAIEDFLLEIKPTAFITVHSFSQVIVPPWGYTKAFRPSNYKFINNLAARAIQNMKKVTGRTYRLRTDSEPVSGVSDDWSRGVLKSKIVFTIELRDTGKYGFLLPASEIVGTGRELKTFLKTIAEAVPLA